MCWKRSSASYPCPQVAGRVLCGRIPLGNGVGDRKTMLNTHWGGTIESNEFGTHEFMMLCESLECEPYICGNVGSGTVQEMAEWIEYMTFEAGTPMSDWRKQNGREEPWKLKYFGVGNENWGAAATCILNTMPICTGVFKPMSAITAAMKYIKLQAAQM